MKIKDSFKDTGALYDKVMTPEETIKWVRERLDSTGIGILQETVRIDRGRLGIPVYVSRYHPSATALTGNYKQMGKGATAEQAEASAIMELVERYSLFDFVRNRHRKLAIMEPDDPDIMPLDDMTRALHPPGPDHDMDKNLLAITRVLPFEWTEAARPADNAILQAPWSWFWPINEYNGSASGNSFEEAAVQAVSEVVERHVCSLVTYKKIVTPEIDQESVKNPVARELLEKFSRAGINLVLKDFSLDTGIPTVGAVAWDPSTFPGRSEIVYTAGTAPNPERALIRALTEVAQLAGDFDTDGKYVESGLPKFSDFREAAYVMECSTMISVHDMPDCGSNNFRTELENMCRNLAARGLGVYIVNITHPVLDIPAAYAIVAGNHFRDRTINLDLAFHCARIASSCPDRKAARSALELIENLYPGRYETAFYMAHLHEEAAEYEKAMEYYRESLKRDPGENDIASIYCHIGLCLRESGHIDQAIMELSRARELNPALKEIHNQIGYCFYIKGEYLNAIEAFEKAIEIDPGSAIDYANIASNLRKLGMMDDAIRFYDMALELDPGIRWAAEHRQELLESTWNNKQDKLP